MTTTNLIAMTGVLAALTLSHAASARSILEFDRAALADPAHVDALYETITRTANHECRTAHNGKAVFGPSVRRRAIERCVAEVVDTALRSINEPALLARHQNGAADEPARVIADRNR